jgi:pentatricopeptide repeat protein
MLIYSVQMLYLILLMAAGRSGDLSLALELEAEMQREGLQPCSGTESALLTVHLQHGLLTEAQAIYKRLRAADVVPHIHAANSLVNAVGKERRLGDVVALVCDMINAGLTPDAYTFAGILGACQRSDECELGLDVYRIMRVRGVPVDNAIAETMLRLCYNRLRQSWRPGGYPPQRLSDGKNSSPSSVGKVSSSVLYHSSGGHREQERAKLLGALTPPGRRLSSAADTGGAVHWQSHAFSVYREASSEGKKPSMRLLNLMFACLRVPWQDATGGENDQSLTLALQTQRLLAGLPSAPEGATQVQGKIGVESIYHVRAISILEEAIVAGLLPSFKAGAPDPIDLRKLPPAVAEVYVLTVVSALQRLVEARRELKNRVVFLVPRYDGHKVFMPSFLNEEGSSSEDEGLNNFKGINGARIPSSASHLTTLTVADTAATEDEASSDEDVFSGALKDDEICTGDERSGLGVAGVLRRLRLWSREYSPEGLIVVEPRQVMRWAKLIQRQVESRSASALAVQKPYGQQSGDDLRKQRSSIRSMGF